MASFLKYIYTKFIRNKIRVFRFFYSSQGNRIFFSISLSFIVGIIDSIGLTLFLPLLELSDDSSFENQEEKLGNLKFILFFFKALDFELNLLNVLKFICFFFVIKGIIKFFDSTYRIRLQRDFLTNLRIMNINLLSNYKYGEFTKLNMGSLFNSITTEIQKVVMAYKGFFTSVQSGIFVFIYFGMALISSPKFSLLVLSFLLLSNFLFRRIYSSTKNISRQITVDGHKFQNQLYQFIYSFKYLNATGTLRFYALRLKKSIMNQEEKHLKLGKLNSKLTSLREPLIIFIICIIIYFQVTYFNSPLGVVLLSLIFFYRAFSFLMNLQTQWNSYLVNIGSVENTIDFIASLKNGQETPQNEKIEFEKMTNSIVFENVGYYYNEDKIILDAINLRFEKNKTYAIVGESGSGKSTIINILSGITKIKSGSILIDGIDYYLFNKTSFQKKIGYITQESIIFNDTIFNNVTFWAEKTSENIQRFWNVIEMVSLSTFIKEAHSGMDFFLESNGINLSGGQRQKISIARELFKKVEILIFDEATSSLDSENELSIQKSIELLSGTVTLIIIAHRLSTVKNSDMIYLLNKGKIESSGTFNFLLGSSEKFRRMVEIQII